MNANLSWNIAGVGPQTRNVAEEAARRAGMRLEQWLDEAIEQAAQSGARADGGHDAERWAEAVDRRLDRISRRERPTGDQELRPAALRGRVEEDVLGSTIDLIHRRVARNERRATRAFESILRMLEQSSAMRRNERKTDDQPAPHDPHSGVSEKPRLDLSAAVSDIARRRRELDARNSPAASRMEQADIAPKGGREDPRRIETVGPQHLAREDIRALSVKLDDLRREQADRRVSAADLNTIRAEIVAMTRSLSELAPRNAVVALEGAIRDLTGRVATLRENGHGETLLAPLDAMAAELRATVKAHDLQLAASGLDREIRAIGGKLDALAKAAIDPESFERIRQQTEEVRNLLAAAAMRSAPVERLEREIGDLADRVERLGASPAPQAESAHMAAFLDDVRKEIERSTPISALMSIERRLEAIAARLDQEIARPPHAVIDPRPFADLVERIESLRRSLEERTWPQANASELNAALEKLSAKLQAADRDGGEAKAVESLLAQMSARLDAIAAPGPDWPAIQDIVDQTARRIEDRGASRVDAEVLAEQIAQIHDRLDAIHQQTGRPYNVESVARELLDRLREAGLPPRSGEVDVRDRLAVDLAELRAEQANADRRTHSRLTALQDILEQLFERVASMEGEVSGDIEDDARTPDRAVAGRRPSATTLPGVEALGGDDISDVAPRGRVAFSWERSQDGKLPASADEDEAGESSPHGEELLLEPGARSPQTAQAAPDRVRSNDSTTNSAISAHIAAARRAAQAALAEDKSKTVNIQRRAAPLRLVSRGVEQAKDFYASNKRSVLFGVAVLIVTTIAVELIGGRRSFLQKSDLEKRPIGAAAVVAPSGKRVDAGGSSIPAWSIDPTPTASLGPQPESATAVSEPLSASRAQTPPELLTTIPDGLPPALRDAVVAGDPGAQYELAQRLAEGRGAPQDRKAAALWFERAASLGLAPAQFRIAAMYEKGIGVARDPAAARRWYLKAAEAGNARAAHNLAVMSAESVDEKPDYPEAARWFRRAGELGVRDSQYNLAILYARGLGVEQDLGKSWMWFSLAASQGDSDAAGKRDEVAAKMDPATLAAAADSLAKFKVAKQNPVANDVVAPPGGWDARSSPPSARQTPSAPAVESRPPAPL